MIHKSKFLRPELLNQIFDQVRDPWTQKYITSVSGRVAALIIVLDPTRTVETSHEPAVLWSGILGEQDPMKWPQDRPYSEFAFAKARAAWRTKMDNALMLTSYPELIQEGDFKFDGGIYTYRGLVVATSGAASGLIDAEISSTFATLIHDSVCALAKSAITDTTVFKF